jgi:hypothetical protein
MQCNLVSNSKKYVLLWQMVVLPMEMHVILGEMVVFLGEMPMFPEEMSNFGCVAFRNGPSSSFNYGWRIFKLKNYMTHLSSSQETWPNPSSFT